MCTPPCSWTGGPIRGPRAWIKRIGAACPCRRVSACAVLTKGGTRPGHTGNRRKSRGQRGNQSGSRGRTIRPATSASRNRGKRAAAASGPRPALNQVDHVEPLTRIAVTRDRICGSYTTRKQLHIRFAAASRPMFLCSKIPSLAFPEVSVWGTQGSTLTRSHSPDTCLPTK